MASVYYGVDIGGNAYSVAVGSSSNSTDIEVVIDDTNKPKRSDVIKALTEIQDRILRGDYSIDV